MQVNQFSTMLEALDFLDGAGFSMHFIGREYGLYCPETGQTVQPEMLNIVCYHRFEGEKDLGDVSVVYVVASEDGLRGTIIDAYGPYADPVLADYLNRIPVK